MNIITLWLNCTSNVSTQRLCDYCDYIVLLPFKGSHVKTVGSHCFKSQFNYDSVLYSFSLCIINNVNSAVAFGTCFSLLYAAAHWASSGGGRLLTPPSMPATDTEEMCQCWHHFASCHHTVLGIWVAVVCWHLTQCHWQTHLSCGLATSCVPALSCSFFYCSGQQDSDESVRPAIYRQLRQEVKRNGGGSIFVLPGCTLVSLSQSSWATGKRKLVLCSHFLWLASRHADSATEPLCSAKLLGRDWTCRQPFSTTIILQPQTLC